MGPAARGDEARSFRVLGWLLVGSALFGIGGQLIALSNSASSALRWVSVLLIVCSLVVLGSGIYFVRVSHRPRRR